TLSAAGGTCPQWGSRGSEDRGTANLRTRECVSLTYPTPAPFVRPWAVGPLAVMSPPVGLGSSPSRPAQKERSPRRVEKYCTMPRNRYPRRWLAAHGCSSLVEALALAHGSGVASLPLYISSQPFPAQRQHRKGMHPMPNTRVFAIADQKGGV